MGDVLVDSPANIVPPHKKAQASTIPNIESFEGLPAEGSDEYVTLKKLQRQLEYVSHQPRSLPLSACGSG